MNKKELDEYLKQDEYLNQLNEEWQLQFIRRQNLESEEGKKKLEHDLLELIDQQQGQHLINDKQKLVDECVKAIRALPLTSDENEKEKLIKELLQKSGVGRGWQDSPGAPRPPGPGWLPEIPQDIRDELNSAMDNGQCKELRTGNGFYRITANEDGSNTLYVDSRWLKEDIYPGQSTMQDYVNEIKKLVGDNEDFKISDMMGEFKNESLKDFLYKADVDYGIRPGSDTPRP